MEQARPQQCMKCQSPLVHLRRKGMIVEMCSGCQGMWFDAGELTMLLEVYRKFDDLQGAETPYKCPRCQDAMRELDFPGTEIQIDRCVGCQGIFLDKGELKLLRGHLERFVPKDRPDMNARADELLNEAERAGELRFSCPKCQGKLWHLKRQGIMVETCSKCQGMWFDAGELTVLLEVYRKIEAGAGTPVEVSCVRCGEGMRELAFPGTDVLVDRCPSCQGIWLDAGEFGQLREQLAKLIPSDGKTMDERARELFDQAEQASRDRRACPRCQGALQDKARSGLQVETCGACQGTWFDAGELTVVLGVSRRLRLKDAKPTEMRCIKCPSEVLQELAYPRTEVLVDTCPDCRGVWLDGGELEQLAQACGRPLK